MRHSDLVVVAYDSAEFDEGFLESVEEYFEGRGVSLEKVVEEIRREKKSGKEG